jgi:hypothetical protein
MGNERNGGKELAVFERFQVEGAARRPVDTCFFRHGFCPLFRKVRSSRPHRIDEGNSGLDA